MSRFVIRSARTGPPELHSELPVSGYTVGALSSVQGDEQFICANLDQPVKYRFSTEFNTGRCQPPRLDSDEHSPFLWVTAVVLQAHMPGERPRAGMLAFPVDLFYVVDLSLGADAFLDANKIDHVAVVEIDDATDAYEDDEDDDAAVNAEQADNPGSELPSTATPPVSPELFQQKLDDMVAALAALAGDPLGGDFVTPERADSEQLPPEQTPAFSLGEDILRYHTFDLKTGWVWRETTDPAELLYWIVDDIASSLAWRWAQKAPAYGAMTEREAKKTLWMPYWHILMHGLRPDWGTRTRATIRTLAAEIPHDASRRWDW